MKRTAVIILLCELLPLIVSLESTSHLKADQQKDIEGSTINETTDTAHDQTTTTQVNDGKSSERGKRMCCNCPYCRNGGCRQPSHGCNCGCGCPCCKCCGTPGCGMQDCGCGRGSNCPWLRAKFLRFRPKTPPPMPQGCDRRGSTCNRNWSNNGRFYMNRKRRNAMWFDPYIEVLKP